jgi:hypothetical protein
MRGSETTASQRAHVVEQISTVSCQTDWPKKDSEFEWLRGQANNASGHRPPTVTPENQVLGREVCVAGSEPGSGCQIRQLDRHQLDPSKKPRSPTQTVITNTSGLR